MKSVKLIPLSLVLVLSGCSTTTLVSEGVDRYCALSVISRTAVRNAVSLAIIPNKIQIICDRDF